MSVAAKGAAYAWSPHGCSETSPPHCQRGLCTKNGFEAQADDFFRDGEEEKNGEKKEKNVLFEQGAGEDPAYFQLTKPPAAVGLL
jgi:hypothetical protein